MTTPVRTRSYRSPRRQEQAAATRRSVLRAARDLFTRDGYATTTVTAVATAAGVSLDTVYASVGRKPELLLEVIRVGRSPRASDRRSPTTPGDGAVAYGAVSPGGAVGFMGETGPSSVRHHRSASSRAYRSGVQPQRASSR